jgi:hypothetical protein
MLCRKGEDVLVKSTVVVAKNNGVYMDRVIPFGQLAQWLVLPAGDLDRLDPAGRDKTTSFCQNQLQATQTA